MRATVLDYLAETIQVIDKRLDNLEILTLTLDSEYDTDIVDEIRIQLKAHFEKKLRELK